MNNLLIIGRSEQLRFPIFGDCTVFARIDTGARTSSIWASKVVRDGDLLKVIFWGEGFPLYTGEEIEFESFGETVVASSNGAAEHRYKVRVLVELHGKKIRATFTLADRSTQAYPVLVGRNILRNKFVVDVSRGDVPVDAEKMRSAALREIFDKKG